MLRMKVKIGDYESSFDEMDESDELEVTMQTKKGATAKDLKGMVAKMRSGGESIWEDPEAAEDADTLREEFQNAVASTGSGKLGHSSGAFADIRLSELGQKRPRIDDDDGEEQAEHPDEKKTTTEEEKKEEEEVWQDMEVRQPSIRSCFCLCVCVCSYLSVCRLVLDPLTFCECQMPQSTLK
jgi:hypothetical protein